jgi:tRNA(fMet)-specific endonuclease VapC
MRRCVWATDSESACPSSASTGLRYRQNPARLQAALGIFRLWPADEDTTAEFAEVFHELRSAGRMLAQFDLLIAAVARQHNLTLLTADQDFQPVSRLRVENWT